MLPAEPHAAALGEERLVSEDQTVRFGSVRYSTPPGHVGTRVWCRVVGEELVIVAMTGSGTAEIARHLLSTPGNPRIVDAHYPHHPGGNQPRPPRPRPRTEGRGRVPGHRRRRAAWLVEAAATGATRVRAKMARAVEFATIIGADKVDQALGLAAAAGRFDDHDLGSIIDHWPTSRRIAVESPQRTWSRADEARLRQLPDAAGWAERVRRLRLLAPASTDRSCGTRPPMAAARRLGSRPAWPSTTGLHARARRTR